MKHLLLFIACLIPLLLSGNDGAFYANGNLLIPIQETDISVQKEILTIKRKNKEQVEISVYYEFFNPGKEKNIIVGFEAESPSGDVNGMPKKNGEHPFIYDFKVNMNDKDLPFNIAHVVDSLYYLNGEFQEISLDEYTPCDNYCGFNYVYYFNTNFKKGLNIIKHTYTLELSGSVTQKYSLTYILTAAMRWANKQIDDFTLIIDMGESEDFYIDNTPFGDWVINGIGEEYKNQGYQTWSDNAGEFVWVETYSHFYMANGEIIFKKKNFKTKDELRLFSKQFYPSESWETFDYTVEKVLPFNSLPSFEKASDPISKKIIRNLPFAQRGYIFSAPELKEYYSNQVWYFPNKEYKAKAEDLTHEEQEWIKYWSEQDQ